MHVTTGLESGGAERILVNFVTTAAKNRRISKVVSLLPGGHYRTELERAQVPVVDLGMERGRPSFKALARLAILIARVRPAAIKSWMYHANILALAGLLLSGRRHKTRLVWGVYNSDLDFTRYGRLLRVVFHLGAWLSPFTDCIVYNSHAALDFHRAAGYRPPLSVVIDNGVDTSCFRPDQTRRARIRSELGISDDTFLMITIARPDPMKSWDVLFEATRAIPGLTMLLVGKGTDELDVGENCIGLGERHDVEHLIAAADLFVLVSSFGEGMSVAATEAMASGLPLVLTDVGDNLRMAGDCAVVVPVGDPQAVRTAVLDLMADPARRQAMGRYARQRALEYFSLDRAYRRFEEVYTA